MLELADRVDSKSTEVTPRVGSTPTSGTNQKIPGKPGVLLIRNYFSIKRLNIKIVIKPERIPTKNPAKISEGQ